MLIDSHCHLNYKGLIEDQQGVLQRARDTGVTGFLNISTRQSEWDAIIATAAREPDVWASVGIHPHEADAHPDLGAQALIDAAAHPKVVGIGETGLDYYYDHSDRAAQRALFRVHIGVARETGLPLIVHTRDAEDDTAEILAEEMGRGAFPALIHCFTASRDFARTVLDLGLSISISGIVTFKNAAHCRKSLAKFPNTVCWLKPTHRFSHLCRIAGKPVSRRLLPIPRASSLRCAGSRLKHSAKLPPVISAAFSRKRLYAADNARFRHLDRCPAHRQ